MWCSVCIKKKNAKCVEGHLLVCRAYFIKLFAVYYFVCAAQLKKNKTLRFFLCCIESKQPMPFRWVNVMVLGGDLD